MKKNKLLLMSILLIPTLIACNGQTYKPRIPFPGDPINGGKQDANATDEEDEDALNMTINFYLDYSHSANANKEYENMPDKNASASEPIYSMRWYMLKPLGECPEQARLTDANAPDPLYGKFLGYSEYPSLLDNSKLWDFANDYKQSNILNLYGIWVSNA